MTGVEVKAAISPLQIEALRSWLVRLETKLAQGDIAAVTVGIDHWTARIQDAIAIEVRSQQVNQFALDLQRELRGRLNALQAKALARGLSEDPTLDQLAQQAQQLLYARPTPLDQATRLVTQYEKYLNAKQN